MASARKPRSPKATILVVDDDPHARRLLATTLRLEGYTAFEAADGPECLSMAREVQPDLIVLDIMMPGMDGFETCRQLREDPHFQHVKVVLLTGRAGGANVLLGHAIGADAYLVKPFELEQVTEQIRALLQPTSSRPPR